MMTSNIILREGASADLVFTALYEGKGVSDKVKLHTSTDLKGLLTPGVITGGPGGKKGTIRMKALKSGKSPCKLVFQHVDLSGDIEGETISTIDVNVEIIRQRLPLTFSWVNKDVVAGKKNVLRFNLIDKDGIPVTDAAYDKPEVKVTNGVLNRVGVSTGSSYKHVDAEPGSYDWNLTTGDLGGEISVRIKYKVDDVYTTVGAELFTTQDCPLVVSRRPGVVNGSLPDPTDIVLTIGRVTEADPKLPQNGTITRITSTGVGSIVTSTPVSVVNGEATIQYKGNGKAGDCNITLTFKDKDKTTTETLDIKLTVLAL